MVESTTVVSLPQMVDLALNSPEVGIVNFTVLHSLLHVIVNQLELTDTNVEFRGSDSERLQGYISTAKPGPLLTLTEYTIGESKSESKKERRRTKRSLEKGKRDEDNNEKGEKDSKEKIKKSSSGASVHSGGRSSVVVVETSKGNIVGPQFTVAITKKHFEKLEVAIEGLDRKVKELAELPGNTALIQALRSDNAESTPVLDMYQILNLTKRLDAAELTMEKIVSMVEDKGKQGLLSIEEDKSEASTESHPAWSEVIERIESLEKKVESVQGEGKEGGEVEAENIQIIQTDLATLKESVEAFAEAMADLEEIKRMLSPSTGEGGENLPPEVRLNQIEVRFTDLVEQVNSLDNVYNRQTSTLQERIDDLEKEFNEIIEKIKLGLPAGDAGMEGQSMSDMYTLLMQLQDDVTTMAGTSQKLIEERDERQHALDVMLEQVELLKTVKADREDLEDALADKADACQINKKVSLEQFDAVCTDMSKAIEEALSKLTEQEGLWSQALDEIQKDVGNKLDKMELTPLRDFINKKLRHLQDKVKTLSAMKKEHEAAGTKTKFLKNVNCISCDKDVIMRKEVDSSLYPKPHALPPTRNMGPYLAYELDQLRKQQKCIPQSKNLNAFENAMQSARSAKSPDHICNRYCGGSHTVTTPQQRVTRIGHFLEQWGPELGPVNEMNIRGTDGQMYKGRDEKALKNLAVEKPQTPASTEQVDQQSLPSTPTTTSGPLSKLKSVQEVTKSGSQMPTIQGSVAGVAAKSGIEVTAKSGSQMPIIQGSVAGVAARSGTEVTGVKSKSASVGSAKKSAAELTSEVETKPSVSEAPGEASEPPPEGPGSPTGTSSPKKARSRSSAGKGSKSSLPKSAPSKQSAEKIEPVPEEAETSPAEE